MTTYAGKNIDESTSAMIYWGHGYENSIDYNARDLDAYGPDHIIETAREIQGEMPHKEVYVAFYKDLNDDDFEVLADGPINDEVIRRFMIDERGNVRPIRG